MELKEILGDEIFSQIQEKVKDKHIIIADGKDDFVPKQRLNDIIQQRNDLQKINDDLVKDVESLKNNKGTAEELQNKLNELTSNHTKTVDEYNGKLIAMQKDYAIDLALHEAGARNTKAVKALLDDKVITISDNGVVGLKEQIETIKTNNDYLFAPKDKVPNVGNGSVNTINTKDNPFSIKSWDMIKQMRMQAENPALAEKLRKEAI